MCGAKEKLLQEERKKIAYSTLCSRTDLEQQSESIFTQKQPRNKLLHFLQDQTWIIKTGDLQIYQQTKVNIYSVELKRKCVGTDLNLDPDDAPTFITQALLHCLQLVPYGGRDDNEVNWRSC